AEALGATAVHVALVLVAHHVGAARRRAPLVLADVARAVGPAPARAAVVALRARRSAAVDVGLGGIALAVGAAGAERHGDGRLPRGAAARRRHPLAADDVVGPAVAQVEQAVRAAAAAGDEARQGEAGEE